MWPYTRSQFVRRPFRTALTVLGIAVASALELSVFSSTSTYRANLVRELDGTGMHMMLVPIGCPYDAAAQVIKGKGLDATIPAEVVNQARRDPATAVASPIFAGSIPRPNLGRTDLWVGVDETAPLLRAWWRLSDGSYPTRNGDILLGAEAAETEMRRIGDALHSPELGRTFRVCGILQRSGTTDDSQFFIRLAEAQKIFHQPGRLTAVGVRLRDPALVRGAVQRMQTFPGAQVVTLAELTGTFLNMVESAQSLLSGVSLVTLVVTILTIYNTMAAAVLERRYEHGILRSLGVSKMQLAGQVFSEAALLGAAGGLVGVIAVGIGQLPAARLFTAWFPLASSRSQPIDPLVAISVVFLAMFLSSLAGIVPARDAMRRDAIMIAKYLWSSLRCRPARTSLTVMGIALAVGLVMLLDALHRGYNRGLDLSLSRLGAHLIVVPKGCPYDAASLALHGASWPCYLNASTLADVEHTEGVAVAAPILMSAAMEPKTGRQFVYNGVDDRLMRLHPSWRVAEGSFPKPGSGVLVGADLARERGFRAGDTITLPGLEGKRTVVRGILESTHGPEDLFFFLPLTDARILFQLPDSLTHILVQLDDPARVEQVTEKLRGCDAGLEMTVVPLSHLFRTIQGIVRSTRTLLGGVGLAAIIAAVVGLANTMATAVSERSGELGMLRAIGASRGLLAGLVAAETLAMSTLGVMAGSVGAAVVRGLFETWVRGRLPFAPPTPIVQFDWVTAGILTAACPVLAAVGAAAPAYRAASLEPAPVMREGKRW